MTCAHCGEEIPGSAFRVNGSLYCNSRCSTKALNRIAETVRVRRALEPDVLEDFFHQVETYLAKAAQ